MKSMGGTARRRQERRGQGGGDAALRDEPAGRDDHRRHGLARRAAPEPARSRAASTPMTDARDAGPARPLRADGRRRPVRALQGVARVTTTRRPACRTASRSTPPRRRSRRCWRRAPGHAEATVSGAMRTRTGGTVMSDQRDDEARGPRPAATSCRRPAWSAAGRSLAGGSLAQGSARRPARST